MSEKILRLVDITKTYGRTTALENVNLEIDRGEFITILGPSGSGKSTLLKIIGGFEEPTSGEIFINGKKVNGVPPYKRPTSTVFQDLALFPHLNVFDNIAYGLKIRKVPDNIIRAKVKDVSELLHIENLLNRKVTQLSGGQQQRVALARSLVIEPEILLLDEPLGPLDLKLRREMQVELRKIQRKLGATWVYVTHDHEEAMVMSDRVVVLRNGRILAFDRIRQLYENPRSKFVAEFLGGTNLRECIVVANDGQYSIAKDGKTIYVFPASNFKVGDKISIIIRPEKIRISRDKPNTEYNYTCGRISEIIFRGPFVDHNIVVDNSETIVVRTLETLFSVGEFVYLSWSDKDIAVVTDP